MRHRRLQLHPFRKVKIVSARFVCGRPPPRLPVARSGPLTSVLCIYVCMLRRSILLHRLVLGCAQPHSAAVVQGLYSEGAARSRCLRVATGPLSQGVIRPRSRCITAPHYGRGCDGGSVSGLKFIRQRDTVAQGASKQPQVPAQQISTQPEFIPKMVSCACLIVSETSNMCIGCDPRFCTRSFVFFLGCASSVFLPADTQTQ